MSRQHTCPRCFNDKAWRAFCPLCKGRGTLSGLVFIAYNLAIDLDAPPHNHTGDLRLLPCAACVTQPQLNKDKQ